MDDPNPGLPRRRRFRLSLRAMMVLVLISGAVLGWVVLRAHVQRDAVQAIRKAGQVVYRSQRGAKGQYTPNAPPRGPRWLNDLVGPDMLDTVVAVVLRGDKVDDRVMAGLGELPSVTSVGIRGKPSPALTPTGISQVGRLSQLEGISALDMPETSGFLPHLYDKRHLRHIYLKSAVASDAALARLVRLPMLEELVLDGRDVTQAGFAHLSTARDLRWLSLENCRVSDLSALSGMRRLGRLNLSARTHRPAERPSSPVDLGPLNSLPSLMMLHLTSIPIDDAGLAKIKRMSQLRSLGVAGAGITEAGLAHIATMPKVNQLALERTSIRDLSELSPLLPGLQGLWVADSPLDDDGLRPIAGATALSQLTLSGTAVTDEGLKHLVGLKTLSFLNLSNARVSGAGLAKLAGLPKLKTLLIRATSVSEASIAALRKALPGLDVYR